MPCISPVCPVLIFRFPVLIGIYLSHQIHHSITLITGCPINSVYFVLYFSPPAGPALSGILLPVEICTFHYKYWHLLLPVEICTFHYKYWHLDILLSQPPIGQIGSLSLPWGILASIYHPYVYCGPTITLALIMQTHTQLEHGSRSWVLTSWCWPYFCCQQWVNSFNLFLSLNWKRNGLPAQCSLPTALY